MNPNTVHRKSCTPNATTARGGQFLVRPANKVRIGLRHGSSDHQNVQRGFHGQGSSHEFRFYSPEMNPGSLHGAACEIQLGDRHTHAGNITPDTYPPRTPRVWNYAT